MDAVDAMVAVVSGEKLLDWFERSNGGTIIFLRSLLVSAIIYAFGLVLHTGSYAEWTWGDVWAWPCYLDFGQLGKDLADTAPWLGGIFAAVYLALYARFASQWSYLAGEYNQIRQTLTNWTPTTSAVHMNLWKAGLIEDALDLHLATKPMFATFISRLLEDRGVVVSFDNITDDKGPERRAKLQQRLHDMGIKTSEEKIAAGLVGMDRGIDL